MSAPVKIIKCNHGKISNNIYKIHFKNKFSHIHAKITQQWTIVAYSLKLSFFTHILCMEVVLLFRVVFSFLLSLTNNEVYNIFSHVCLTFIHCFYCFRGLLLLYSQYFVCTILKSSKSSAYLTIRINLRSLPEL